MIVLSDAVMKRMQEAGVIQDIGMLQRVVIDLQCGHIPVIHVRQVGDDRLLDVVETLDGAKVVTGDGQ